MHSSCIPRDNRDQMKGKRANNRPVLARDWTRGQHKRVIISFFLFYAFGYSSWLRRTGPGSDWDISWTIAIPGQDQEPLEIYPGTLMRWRLHELYIDWLFGIVPSVAFAVMVLLENRTRETVKDSYSWWDYSNSGYPISIAGVIEPRDWYIVLVLHLPSSFHYSFLFWEDTPFVSLLTSVYADTSLLFFFFFSWLERQCSF